MSAAKVTLVFLLRSGEVLLGLKKTGFGTGKVVGIGGHLETGESARDAAVREVFEETSVRVQSADLYYRGSVRFRFPAMPDWDMDTEVFSALNWQGEPQESAEIAPRWHRLDALPLTQMWQDAEHWLPLMLSYPEGEQITQRFIVRMATDNESVESVQTESERQVSEARER
ncbi:8-oxo-dGTP diphosphatase [Psychromicrobium lacuslunae]|uniref:Oxidized purine nucleoside triphosphate hydrolase n=1 Tax=Psychromicrobium lacuslunae TaxID=1618207 RepID=A0A0D4BWG7_9MICC|nr:8-oxo-dGTP diphosphatase [Psychromicrobium lacuslunae]AJT40653.1 NUDIX hydrolase [Psychromicrobium lacuslunae]